MILQQSPINEKFNKEAVGGENTPIDIAEPCPHCHGKGVVLSHKKVGAILKQYRTMNSHTMQEVADVMGIGSPYLSELERGKKKWTDLLRDSFMNSVDFLTTLKKGGTPSHDPISDAIRHAGETIKEAVKV